MANLSNIMRSLAAMGYNTNNLSYFYYEDIPFSVLHPNNHIAHHSNFDGIQKVSSTQMRHNEFQQKKGVTSKRTKKSRLSFFAGMNSVFQVQIN